MKQVVEFCESRLVDLGTGTDVLGIAIVSIVLGSLLLFFLGVGLYYRRSWPFNGPQR